jgi:hypothetical protein
MVNETHVDCFNFLNFFFSRDLMEIDICNNFFYFALGLADTELLNGAVGVLRTNNTIVEFVGDDDEGNVEYIPRSW